MSEVARWFERRFDFSFPVELYPNVCVRCAEFRRGWRNGFRAARLKLWQRVEELGPATFGRTALHPRLKTPLRLVDHLIFVAEHDDHHLAQTWNMLRAEQ